MRPVQQAYMLSFRLGRCNSAVVIKSTFIYIQIILFECAQQDSQISQNVRLRALTYYRSPFH